MKKMFLLLCFFALHYHAFCQGLNIAIEAGPNVSTFVPGNGQEPGGTTSSPIFGFHAGAFAGIALGKLYIDPGVLYESVGGSLNLYPDHFGSSNSSQINRVQYLQVPLNILYSSRGKFFVGGGPYIAFGLSGKTTDSYNNAGGSPPIPPYSSKYIFSSSDNPDYGFNTEAAIHVQGNFIFAIGYGMSLKSLSNNGMKASVYSLAVAHTLW